MTIVEPLMIDLHSSVPSYRQLADQLRAAIETGAIAPRDPLPSLTRIRQETGLAVSTIQHAVSVLVAEGYAYKVPGRGTFAARPDVCLSVARRG
jgi:GntR family transcriptional regulator